VLHISNACTRPFMDDSFHFWQAAHSRSTSSGLSPPCSSFAESWGQSGSMLSRNWFKRVSRRGQRHARDCGTILAIFALPPPPTHCRHPRETIRNSVYITIAIPATVLTSISSAMVLLSAAWRCVGMIIMMNRGSILCQLPIRDKYSTWHSMLYVCRQSWLSYKCHSKVCWTSTGTGY
jgi:hypothetical protein